MGNKCCAQDEKKALDDAKTTSAIEATLQENLETYVLFKSMDGNSSRVTVGADMQQKVSDLKASFMLQNSAFIDGQFKILFNSASLDDNKTLSECGLTPKAELVVVRWGGDQSELCDGRPTDFVVLDKPSQVCKLGMDANRQTLQSTRLLVTKIKEGLLDDWNKKNPSRAVTVGHYITAVNGVRGNASELVDEIKNAETAGMMYVFNICRET